MLLLSLIAALSVSAAKLPPDVEALVKQANTAFIKKKYPEALALYQQAYEKKKVSSFLYGMAQAHKRMGDYKKALPLLEQYTKTLPKGKTKSGIDDQIRDLKLALDIKSDAAPTGPPAAEPIKPKPVQEEDIGPPVEIPASAPVEKPKPRPAAAAPQPKPKPKQEELAVMPEIPLAPADPTLDLKAEPPSPLATEAKKFRVSASAGAFIPITRLKVNYSLNVGFAFMPLAWLRVGAQIDFQLLRSNTDTVARGYGLGALSQSTVLIPIFLGAAIDLAALADATWPVRPIAGVDFGLVIAAFDVTMFSRRVIDARVRPAFSAWAGVEIPVWDQLSIDVTARYLEVDVGKPSLSSGVDIGEGRLSGIALRAGAGYRF